MFCIYLNQLRFIFIWAEPDCVFKHFLETLGVPVPEGDILQIIERSLEQRHSYNDLEKMKIEEMSPQPVIVIVTSACGRRDAQMSYRVMCPAIRSPIVACSFTNYIQLQIYLQIAFINVALTSIVSFVSQFIIYNLQQNEAINNITFIFFRCKSK